MQKFKKNISESQLDLKKINLAKSLSLTQNADDSLNTNLRGLLTHIVGVGHSKAIGP